MHNIYVYLLDSNDNNYTLQINVIKSNNTPIETLQGVLGTSDIFIKATLIDLIGESEKQVRFYDMYDVGSLSIYLWDGTSRSLLTASATFYDSITQL